MLVLSMLGLCNFGREGLALWQHAGSTYKMNAGKLEKYFILHKIQIHYVRGGEFIRFFIILFSIQSEWIFYMFNDVCLGHFFSFFYLLYTHFFLFVVVAVGCMFFIYTWKSLLSCCHISKVQAAFDNQILKWRFLAAV